MSMEVKENKGLKYYLDDIAEVLAERYYPATIGGPHGLTGDFKDECAVWPFLLAAASTNKYWGFDFEGYQSVVRIFEQNKKQGSYMAFAKGRVETAKDLDSLVEAGHLRKVLHNDTTVYFVTEQLVAKATASNK